MVALKVVDDSSQSSDVSNIVVVSFRRLTTTTTSTTTTTTTISPSSTSVTAPKGNDSFISVGPIKLTLIWLILIIIAAVIVTTLIFICVLCIVLRCKKPRDRNSSLGDIELQDPTSIAAAKSDDLKPKDNIYENAQFVSIDTSRDKPHVTSYYKKRPEPIGLSDTSHVERKPAGAGKLISRQMSPVSPAKANSRASGSYATTIEPAPELSRTTPTHISGDFTKRIGPEGSVSEAPAPTNPRTPTRTPIPSPAVTPARAHPPNPSGTYAKAPPLPSSYDNATDRPPDVQGARAKTPPATLPKPTHTNAITPPPDQSGIYANWPPTSPHARARAPAQNPIGTHQRTVTPPPENDASSDESTYDDGQTRNRTHEGTMSAGSDTDSLYDDVHTLHNNHPDAVSRISSCSSDYQDVAPTPGTTPGCVRRTPIGAENVADTPSSTTGIPGLT